jgi:3-keto-5-aminohexanoate cleavage enzyme
MGADLIECGIAELAIERGGHIHVGLEAFGGSRTPTNPELIREVVVGIATHHRRELVSAPLATQWLGVA